MLNLPRFEFHSGEGVARVVSELSHKPHDLVRADFREAVQTVR